MTTPRGKIHEIRDLIYLDERKAASLLSQIEGGLTTVTHATTEATTGNRSARNWDFKVLRPESEQTSADRSSLVEERTLHHAMLNRLEEWLAHAGVLTRIDEASSVAGPGGFAEVRAEILSQPFAEVRGLAVIQDFDALTKLFDNFNPLVDFIARAGRHAVESSESYATMMSDLAELKKQAAAPGVSPKLRSQFKVQLRDAQEGLEAILGSVGSNSQLPPWFAAGLRLFMESFMPGRISLSVQPRLDSPEFHVVANLRRDCFVDSGVSEVLYAYGTRPAVPLTVLGYLTSAAQEGPDAPERAQRGGSGALATAFEGVFSALEELESLVSTATFPSLSVYPIAVYRRLVESTDSTES